MCRFGSDLWYFATSLLGGSDVVWYLGRSKLHALVEYQGHLSIS